MKAIAFSFGTATPLMVIVIPEGGALGAGQLPDVATPDEPPLATPDEPPLVTPEEPPPPLPEGGVAPVEDPPFDGLPVATPEPVDGGMDPDVNTVPLLVAPLLVAPPLVAPLLNEGRVVAGSGSPWCS